MLQSATIGIILPFVLVGTIRHPRLLLCAEGVRILVEVTIGCIVLRSFSAQGSSSPLRLRLGLWRLVDLARGLLSEFRFVLVLAGRLKTLLPALVVGGGAAHHRLLDGALVHRLARIEVAVRLHLHLLLHLHW